MNNRFEFYRMNNYKYCKHDPIWDHSTGSEVCLNCGLVLCEGLSYNELHLQHHGGEMPMDALELQLGQTISEVHGVLFVVFARGRAFQPEACRRQKN